MTDHLIPPSAERLENYLAGEASPEESAAIADWIGEDSVRQTMALGLKSLDQTRVDRSVAPDINQLWSRVNAQMNDHSASVSVRHHRWLPRRLQVALGTVAFAIIAVFSGRLWLERSPVILHQVSQEYREYATAVGQTAAVTLDDGTKVILAPGSVLRYSQSFGSQGRDVYLRGEAYFNVVNRPAQPFVVFTSGSSTQVLGTEFSVRHYASDSSVQVAVVTGKVALMMRADERQSSESLFVDKADQSAIILSSGEQGVLTNGRIMLTQIPVVAPTWISGKLVYTNTPLRIILADLQRWHGITFKLDDAMLGERRLTASFNTATFNSEELAGLTTPLGFGYVREDNTITLFAR